MSENFIQPSQELIAELLSRNISGEVVMLNLLRFRDVADYSATPEQAPAEPISGRDAYQKYIEHSLPFIRDSGGELVFLGQGGQFLIGPQEEYWDLVMLVRQKSLQDFMAFISNDAYLAGICHRTAALEDSRLLPINESGSYPQ